MSVATTIYPQSVSGLITASSTTGGTLRFEWDVSGDPFEDWTGDSLWPTFFAVVNHKARVKIRCRETTLSGSIPALGTSGSLTLTLVGNSNTATITLIGMVFYGKNAEQDRGSGGMVTLSFGYESADGTTAPDS